MTLYRHAMKASAVLSLLAVASAAQADETITILHTNDFHSRFEPISKYDSGCSAEDNEAGECFGGYARLVTAVGEARTRNPNALLVDGGDQFQGSLFYTFYKGEAAAEMMNELKYDAMTVGNHEFDDGPEVLAGFMGKVDFPVLMSNGDVSQEPALADILQKSTVLTKGNVTIGLIGLTPQDTKDLASPGKNITFSDPVAAVQAEVDRLTEEGIDKIVVLSHSGFNVDLNVAENTTGVDVIVGGHSNTLLSNTHEDAKGAYPTMVGDTAIVQAYAYGKFLGELSVTFDDDGVITEATGEPLLIDGAVAEDADIVARVAEMAVPLDEIRTKVVAESAALIEGSRDVCRVQECEMGNLIADAMLSRVADQGVTLALMNSGGIRSSIDAGEVTMGDVLSVLPFQNTLSTFKISGADVIAALENGVSQVEDVKGRFPQVAGMKFTWDPAQPAGEGRIQEVLVQSGDTWEPIDESAMYGVVSNNFVRGGGDGYDIFATNASEAYDFGPDLDSVLADYMAENGMFEPGLDGRITSK